MCVRACKRACVRVCVCDRERERVCVCVCERVRACVCVRERERDYYLGLMLLERHSIFCSTRYNLSVERTGAGVE